LKLIPLALDVLQSRSVGLIRLRHERNGTGRRCSKGDISKRKSSPLCPLVPALLISFRNLEEIMSERKCERRSRHDLAMGSALRARTESSLPSGTAEYEPVVACRRDVLPRRWQVDPFLTARWIRPAPRSTSSLARNVPRLRPNDFFKKRYAHRSPGRGLST
jgi:hypothetical protein